jgi:methyl-accepting chemotaxis protein
LAVADLSPPQRKDVRVSWRLKAILPVAGVLLLGLLVFVFVTLSFERPQRHTVILVAAAGAVAICTVVLVVLAVLIQRPLVELHEEIARLRDGDLTAAVRFANRNDEWGELGRNFNQMVRQLGEPGRNPAAAGRGQHADFPR